MPAVVVLPHDFNQTFGQLEGRVDRIRKSAPVLRAHDEAVDDDGYAVVELPVEPRRICDLDQITIDVGADESLFPRGFKEVLELAFATANEGRKNLDLRSRRPRENGVGNLARALSLDCAAAVWAVRSSRAREEEAEIVVDLRYGANGGARIVPGGLLFY